MYDVLFYAGLVLSAAFLIAAVILFFGNRIPTVIRYFVHISGKKIRRTPMLDYPVKEKSAPADDEATEILNSADEPTELLDIAQQYATALLDADSTTLLPSLDSED